MEHLTGRYFGPYRLTSILGSGGMGTVFLAHEEELDRPVAVKVLAPSLSKDSNFVERFTREARFLAALSHPNLIHVYSIGSTEDGYHYMAMEYLEGETLDELIDREAPLDVDTTWRITAQVLKALWAIHKAGLVHRDVKPSNIMICRDGRAVLMDFGLAKAHDLPGLTREGIIAGTPEYMSPEQATGEELDNRSDLYSLGVTMFEMLTGRVPFQGTSAISVLRQHCEDPPPDVLELNPALPAAVSPVVGRALAKDRDERYADATEMAAAMAAVAETTDLAELSRSTRKSALPRTRVIETPAGTAAPSEAGAKGARRKGLMWAAAAAVLAALLAGGWFLAGRGGDGKGGSKGGTDVLQKWFPGERTGKDEEGRPFVLNPICEFRIEGGPPEYGRLIAIEDDKVIWQPMGTREKKETKGKVEVEILSAEQLRKLARELAARKR